jgi:hypothetical protein
VLVTQSLAMAAKVSASLPKVVGTNVDVQALFRCSPEDAHALRYLLPVTGRRARPASLPWEGERRPFLTEEEELRQLEKEASALQRRQFYFKSNLWPCPAVLVRAGDVEIPRGAWRGAPPPPVQAEAPLFEPVDDEVQALPQVEGQAAVFEPVDEPAPKRRRPR